MYRTNEILNRVNIINELTIAGGATISSITDTIIVVSNVITGTMETRVGITWFRFG